MPNLSVGFLKRAIVRPVSPEPPEYVTISFPPRVPGDETPVKEEPRGR
jgi:hypothetical protein